MQLAARPHADGARCGSRPDDGRTTHHLTLHNSLGACNSQPAISMRHVGINTSGEHWRHLQTCCQNFFHGAVGPACDTVTVDLSALAPRRGWRNPRLCDFRRTASEARAPGQRWDSSRVHSPGTCQSRPGLLGKPPAEGRRHTVSAELSRSGKRRPPLFCFCCEQWGFPHAHCPVIHRQRAWPLTPTFGTAHVRLPPWVAGRVVLTMQECAVNRFTSRKWLMLLNTATLHKLNTTNHVVTIENRGGVINWQIFFI